MSKALHKRKYIVENMHCVSCSILIEEELENSRCAENANCSYASSELVLESKDPIDDTKVIEVLSKLGYRAHPKE